MYTLFIFILTLVFPKFFIVKVYEVNNQKPNQTETSHLSKEETNHKSLFLQNLSEISFSLHLERKFLKTPSEYQPCFLIHCFLLH